MQKLLFLLRRGGKVTHTGDPSLPIEGLAICKRGRAPPVRRGPTASQPSDPRPGCPGPRGGPRHAGDHDLCPPCSPCGNPPFLEKHHFLVWNQPWGEGGGDGTEAGGGDGGAGRRCSSASDSGLVLGPRCGEPAQGGGGGAQRPPPGAGLQVRAPLGENVPAGQTQSTTSWSLLTPARKGHYSGPGPCAPPRDLRPSFGTSALPGRTHHRQVWKWR